ncbi:MAG TPA: hypothetical protein VLM37_10405 [Fibrobacteraceae bacterium]|nr:hypothetical protein [Fibrobacteraceae bacterium]
MFFRRTYVLRSKPSFRWKLLGWTVVILSMLLGAYVKILWVRYTETPRSLPPSQTWEDEAKRLNQAIETTPER